MAIERIGVVSVYDFPWFREILVRGRDLAEVLSAETELSPAAQKALDQFSAALYAHNAEADVQRTDLRLPASW